MNFDLTTEQTMLVDTVRSFVEKELYPNEAEVERLDEVPAELARHLQGRAAPILPTIHQHLQSVLLAHAALPRPAQAGSSIGIRRKPAGS